VDGTTEKVASSDAAVQEGQSLVSCLGVMSTPGDAHARPYWDEAGTMA